MNRSKDARAAALHQAVAVMEHVPFGDGHNDLPFVIRNDSIAKGDVAAYDLNRVHQDGGTDIPRLRAGRVGARRYGRRSFQVKPDESRKPGHGIAIYMMQYTSFPSIIHFTAPRQWRPKR